MGSLVASMFVLVLGRCGEEGRTSGSRGPPFGIEFDVGFELELVCCAVVASSVRLSLRSIVKPMSPFAHETRTHLLGPSSSSSSPSASLERFARSISIDVGSAALFRVSADLGLSFAWYFKMAGSKWPEFLT